MLVHSIIMVSVIYLCFFRLVLDLSDVVLDIVCKAFQFHIKYVLVNVCVCVSAISEVDPSKHFDDCRHNCDTDGCKQIKERQAKKPKHEEKRKIFIWIFGA